MISRTHTADKLNRSTTRPARQRRGRQAVIEALEERQLMSLTVEVRAADGSSSATVSNGQVLNLQIVAVITAGIANPADSDRVLSTDPSTFGINDVLGSFISTGIYTGDVAGNLAATFPGTFQANGYQFGTQQDLNGDGNIDVGATGPANATDYFLARHGGIYTNGVVNGDAMVIDIGTLTYTVTNLNLGGETDINFVPAPTATGQYHVADWYDGVQYQYDPTTQMGAYASELVSTVQGGTPFVVTDTALNPAPVVNTDNATTLRDTPLTVNALGNVTTSDSLVVASVAIANPPTHGSAVAQSGGSILYTPDAGYVGTDSFTYHVTDSNGKMSNDGPVNITVTAPPPPIAVADSASTLRNQPTTINVIANDTDASTGTIIPDTVVVQTQPADGHAVANGDGTVTYTPDAGFTGTDTFTYTVSDTLSDSSAPGTVTVDVTVPIPPVAVDDTEGALQGHPATLAVLSNDVPHSVAIDPTTVTIGTPPADGSAVPQADGTIIYTPNAGFLGTDSFTYTVNDIIGDISNIATVTVNVTPVIPPTATDDAVTDVESQPATLSVLANDTAGSVAIDPTTVLIGTAPANGTAVAQADGTVIYTSNAGFIGTDTFTYTVNDIYGDPSNTATVTVGVTAAPAPVASNFTVPITSSGATTINVLGNVSAVDGLVPSSVAVSTAPVNGTATVDPTTGNILYTASAGFVGTDSFAFTAGDLNGNTSAPATVTVNVGTEISNAKGANRTITFVDSAGGMQVVTLNHGTADVIFTGSGMSTTNHGRVSITGTGLEISEIDLSGTSNGSSLVVRGIRNAPTTIGGITDSDPLGNINARTADLSGTINVNGLRSLSIGSLSNASVVIGSGSPRVALSLGTVASSAISSAAAVSSLRVTSWTNTNDGTPVIGLTAPSAGSIFSTGAFNPDITLTGNSRAPDINSARVNGALGGSWNIAGTVGSVLASSVDNTWTPSIGGALNSLNIRGGGLASPLSAGSLGVLNITGDLSTSITAASARAIHVNGSINAATLTFTGAAGVNQIVASSLVDSIITAGNTVGTTLATASATNLGTATIGSIVLNGRSGTQFSGSSIMADKIHSASLGVIDTDNGGTPEGIATTNIRSTSAIFGGNTIHLGPHQLNSESLLQSYITQQSISFGDFEIDIV